MKPFSLRNVVGSIALCLSVGAQAQSSPADSSPSQGLEAATRRAATLTHGTNLSGWFGGAGDYSESHTSTYLTAMDFSLMKSLGIRYVRFPLDPVLFLRARTAAEKQEVWKRVDAALDMVMNAGLAVDFVVFPNDEFKQQLTTQTGVDHFILLWQMLATHLASRDPERFFFELMNESEMGDPYRWVGVQSQVSEAIRAVAPRHTILASGAHYDSLPDLLETEPITDDNVIYTFHFYEPYPFTHQGALWGSFEWNYFKNIPYPATPAQIAAIEPSVPAGNARYQLFLYGLGDWNASGIAARLAFAADWSHEHHRPVICNEFGAFRDTAPPDSRARYLHDVRTGLEQNGLGWAMWDWSGNFGLVTHADGKVVADRTDVQALGLAQP